MGQYKELQCFFFFISGMCRVVYYIAIADIVQKSVMYCKLTYIFFQYVVNVYCLLFAPRCWKLHWSMRTLIQYNSLKFFPDDD